MPLPSLPQGIYTKETDELTRSELSLESPKQIMAGAFNGPSPNRLNTLEDTPGSSATIEDRRFECINPMAKAKDAPY